MSESEVENTENKPIEAEIIERSDDTVVLEKAAVEPETVAPVVAKKGSFLSFVTFIFALGALAISAYIYYLEYFNKDSSAITPTWQAPLTALDKKLVQQNNAVSQQLSALKSDTQQLQTQIQDLTAKATELQTLSQADGNNPVLEKFDDSVLINQINNLETKIKQQVKSVAALQKQLLTSEQQHKQSIEQLHNEMQSQPTAALLEMPNKVQNTFIFDKAVSLLQAAHIQLNFNANLTKAQTLIRDTIEQLQLLNTPIFQNLAAELKALNQELDGINLADTPALNKQIDELSASSAQLELKTAAQVTNSKENSSWYDNLITIRKVEDPHTELRTKSDDLAVMHNINNHYKLLKMALLSKDQSLWQEELSQLQELLTLGFADNAQAIIAQLKQLEAVNINPAFPDLSIYLQRLTNSQPHLSEDQ
ncbi:MAG TPA: hypothetical protein ENJ41_08500 [Oceanospirillales bacterium]|nr:hypothetical protein [Oceanospirillales bacterium]